MWLEVTNMGKMHRAQILIDPEQHQALAEIAQQEGTSISEIVRHAVQHWLAERHADQVLHRQMDALEEIDRHRQLILNRRDGKALEHDLVELIEQMREERDGELITGSLSHRR
jgi:hypothetical protein